MNGRIKTAILLLFVGVTAAGCVVAAAGAGAVGGIHLTSQEGIGILKTLSESGTLLERGEVLPLQG